MDKIVKKGFKYLKGTIEVPPDKSLSHRAIILSSLAKGISTIKNFSKAKDPYSSLEICRHLGVNIEILEDKILVNSDGKFKKPTSFLYCGNSGTTIRLFAGILSGQTFDTTLTADESLSKRPMKRIITPLCLMGAKISSNNNTSPLIIHPSLLHAIDYISDISSAQVKSCVLLAGLYAQGTTSYTEPYLSRNHTEIMLKNMEANLEINGNTTTIKPSKLHPLEIEISGDISSAAYFIIAGLLIPKSEMLLKNVNINSTRAGLIKILDMIGADYEILDRREICMEQVADIYVKYTSDLKSFKITPDIIPSLIDEIPIIALLSTQCKGTTVIQGAQDLRNKESDRIKCTVSELRKLGAHIKETADGMEIIGNFPLKGGVNVNSYKDHRLAMTLYVAGLIAQNEIMISDFDWIDISFPEFEELFTQLQK